MKSNKLVARFVNVLDSLDKDGIRVPGMILSHPGFGKTSTIKAYCEYRDYNLVTIIPSQFAADDILGLQTVSPKTEELKRLTPSWYNKMLKTMENGKRTILFIDEISTCNPDVEKPLLNLIFERDLGEVKLPENVFIIAAGNYSEDLDGEFKMSSPLVNRFVLLNLRSEDVDFGEIRRRTFSKLRTPEEKAEFFGFDPETPVYNYRALEEWMEIENEIQPSVSCHTDEIEGIGLVGFASARSLDNSQWFVERYMETYGDEEWVRVMGDTLGYSVKREGKLISSILEANLEEFKGIKVKEDLRSLEEMCKEALHGGINGDLVKAMLDRIVGTKDLSGLSQADVRAYYKVMKQFEGNKDLEYVTNEFLKKVTAQMG